MPLSMVPAGESNVIRRVGGREDTRLFLEKLGFVVGSTVTVISEAAGSLIRSEEHTSELQSPY